MYQTQNKTHTMVSENVSVRVSESRTNSPGRRELISEEELMDNAASRAKEREREEEEENNPPNITRLVPINEVEEGT